MNEFIFMHSRKVESGVYGAQIIMEENGITDALVAISAKRSHKMNVSHISWFVFFSLFF